MALNTFPLNMPEQPMRRHAGRPVGSEATNLLRGVPSAGKTNHALLSYWARILLVSIFLTSPFGVRFLTFSDHFLVEPFLAVLGAIVLTDRQLSKFSFRSVNRAGPLNALILLVALFLWGALVLGDLVAAYGDFRSCVAIVISFALVINIRTRHRDIQQPLLHVLLISVILDLTFMRIFPTENIIKMGFNILGSALLLYLAAKQLRPIVFAFGAAAISFEAVVSFYRTYWIVAALSVICFGLLLIWGLFRAKRVGFALTLATVLIVVSISVFTGQTFSNFFRSSQSRFIQSIGKTDQLLSALSGEASVGKGDDLRLAYYTFIVSQPLSVIIPHGLGSRAVFGKVDEWFDKYATSANTDDSGIFYMVYHFGLILAGLIFYVAFRQLVKRLKHSTTIDRLFVLVGALILIAYLSTDGDVFVVIQRGVFAGAFGGALLNRWI